MNREVSFRGVAIFYESFDFWGYFLNIISWIEKSYSEGSLFSKYHLGFEVIFLKYHKVNRALSFGGELFSKYHSGFMVIFEISFGY